MVKRTYTLEDIRRRREKLEAALVSGENVLKKDFDALLGPDEAPARSGLGQWIVRAEKAYYLADGILWGYKMLNLMRGKFRARKR